MELIMGHPLAGHGRRVGVAHHPRAGWWEGLLTRQDGGDAPVAVRIGPLPAWCPEEQAPVAGLAGDREYTLPGVMTSLDGERMAIGNDGLTVVFDRCVESGNPLHWTLAVRLNMLKMAYTQRVSTLSLDVPGGTKKPYSRDSDSDEALGYLAKSDCQSAAANRVTAFFIPVWSEADLIWS
jgi:hypothetical protein